MFLLFLPTGPITTEMFEIVPAHLRASAVALCTFCIHLFGDLGSPALVGSISQKAHDMMTAAGSAAALADTENAIGLRYGVLTAARRAGPSARCCGARSSLAAPRSAHEDHWRDCFPATPAT